MPGAIVGPFPCSPYDIVTVRKNGFMGSCAKRGPFMGLREVPLALGRTASQGQCQDWNLGF